MAQKHQAQSDLRWFGKSDIATRMKKRELYWHVGFDDGTVEYFWAAQRVSREEYLVYSGKDDPAAPSATPKKPEVVPVLTAKRRSGA